MKNLFKRFPARFARFTLALLMSCGLVLPFFATVQAQTDPTPAPPAWFKDVPAYSNLEKLEIPDSVLTDLNLSRSQFYLTAGLSNDSVASIADFYVSKLGAAGWKSQRSPLPTEEQGQQLLFTNPQKLGATLIVLVVSKTALQSAPQFKALDSLVPEGKNLVALGAPVFAAPAATTPAQSTANPAATVPAKSSSGEAIPAQPAATPTTAPEDLAQAPNWFNFIPIYSDLKKVTLDEASLSTVGLSLSRYYATAGATSDSVAKVTEFYIKEMRARGWGPPEKTPLPSEQVGIQLTFQAGSRELTVLIASKAALALAPQFKTLDAQLGPGQTLVALAAPGDGPPERATRCTPGAECAVGPYKVKVSLSSPTFNTTDTFSVTVERLDKPGGDWQMQLETKPSTSTEATPVKFTGAFERGSAPKRQSDINFPISGNWYLYVTIKDSAGEAKLLVPAKVEPPALMPEWLAWTLGLSPLLGVAGFAFGQWRLIVKRNRAKAHLNPEPDPVTTAA